LGYVKELRALIGQRPLILPGACALLIDPSGRLLMHRRLDNGLYGVPGGTMEPGETLEETARRETLEETGYAAGELHLLNIYSGPQLFYCYPNGDQTYNVTAAYYCTDFQQVTSRLDGESFAPEFFALENLPAQISTPILPILRDLQEQWFTKRLVL
jgi:8-oxo-dGTP pyrophosphatase MutT (NUDIX family)